MADDYSLDDVYGTAPAAPSATPPATQDDYSIDAAYSAPPAPAASRDAAERRQVHRRHELSAHRGDPRSGDLRTVREWRHDGRPRCNSPADATASRRQLLPTLRARPRVSTADAGRAIRDGRHDGRALCARCARDRPRGRRRRTLRGARALAFSRRASPIKDFRRGVGALATPFLEMLARSGLAVGKVGAPIVANVGRAVLNPPKAGTVAAGRVLADADNTLPALPQPTPADVAAARGDVQAATSGIGTGTTPDVAGQQIRTDLTQTQAELQNARTTATDPIAAARDASTATCEHRSGPSGHQPEAPRPRQARKRRRSTAPSTI